MLKGIDPLLGPELLATLRAMGHADEICITDANFPSASRAKRLIRADGNPATDLVRAIASVMPIDDFVPVAAFHMAVSGKAHEVPPIIAEFSAILIESGYRGPIEPLERFTFYERASRAYAIVATGEERLWGNIILIKGWLPPGSYVGLARKKFRQTSEKGPGARRLRDLPYAD